ncbi:hypothetical protein [Pseudomonas sp. WPR_5_2]|uniref:hypothetical protein n=1 Tax=Pseudomonas sp. WPR_5_2 TaxID=1907371 RepID=UPI0011C4A19F|nr:hypothetical protein [Pseudomonas sp. WPR_5_2]
MTAFSTTTKSRKSTLARLELHVAGMRARIQTPFDMVVLILSRTGVERTVMKLYSHKFQILNLPVDSFVVSRREVSRTQISSLLSAINELNNSKLSKAELDEILLFYGLIPEADDEL